MEAGLERISVKLHELSVFLNRFREKNALDPATTWKLKNCREESLQLSNMLDEELSTEHGDTWEEWKRTRSNPGGDPRLPDLQGLLDFDSQNPSSSRTKSIYLSLSH